MRSTASVPGLDLAVMDALHRPYADRWAVSQRCKRKPAKALSNDRSCTANLATPGGHLETQDHDPNCTLCFPE